jgi:peptidyl-tRNA hydrolase
VRSDLAAGLQIAQAVHAAFQFAQDHPEHVGRWMRDSKFLVVVSVDDLARLTTLTAKAALRGISHSLWIEPDLGNQATALALEPGEASRRLCGNLSLALRDRQAVAV